MYSRKRVGPKIEPWGTPALMCLVEDLWPSRATDILKKRGYEGVKLSNNAIRRELVQTLVSDLVKCRNVQGNRPGLSSLVEDAADMLSDIRKEICSGT